MFDVISAFKNYERHLKDEFSDNTANGYSLNVKMFLEYIYDVRHLTQLYNHPHRPFPTMTENDIKVWFEKLSSVGYSPASLKIFKYSLKNFFDYLLKAYGMDIPNIDKVAVPKVEVTDIEDINALTDREIKEIADSIDNVRDKCIIMLMYEAGLRRQELIDLKINHIDFAENRVNILRNGKVDRVGYFSPSTHALLNQYMWEWEQETKDTNRKRHNEFQRYGVSYVPVIESDYLFKTNRSPQISYITIYRAIKNASFEYYLNQGIKKGMADKDAEQYANEMTTNVDSETLRHSRRAFYFSMGKTVEQVQILMGDENYWTTKRYLKLAQQLYPDSFK